MVHRRQAAFAVVFRTSGSQSPTAAPICSRQSDSGLYPASDAAHPARRPLLFLIGAEEIMSPSCAPVRSRIRFHDFSGQEFGHRAVDPVHAFGTLGHFIIGQPFRAVDLHKVAVFVNQLAGQRGPPRTRRAATRAFQDRWPGRQRPRIPQTSAGRRRPPAPSGYADPVYRSHSDVRLRRRS